MFDLKKIGISNIIVTVFVIGIVFAFMVFTGAIKLGKDAKNTKGKVVVWGTIPYNIMQPYIDMAMTSNISVSYSVQSKFTYESDLVNAFASGKGPDLFIMPHENILRHADKVFEIPYTSFPKAQYQSTYINESEVFLTENGILAIPMSVDPMVMYYNKQLISSAFLIGVPKYWTELSKFASDITVSDPNGYISISGAALGTYDNINNAKGIISTILMQNGNNIVGVNPTTGQKQAVISADDISAEKAMQSLTFYLSFARKGLENYSWNEAVTPSREKFIAGELAFYFGRASELETIRKKNPNLDFDVSFMPQINKTSIKSTYGAMTGIAISKQTKNIPAAIQVASKLSGKEISKGLTKQLFVAPARYDLLKDEPKDARLNVFYKSAIISRGWVDPDPEGTDVLFKNLVNSVNSGSLPLGNALRKINTDLDVILNRTINTTIKNKITEVDANQQKMY